MLLVISTKYYYIIMDNRVANYFNTYKDSKKDAQKFLTMIRTLVHTRHIYKLNRTYSYEYIQSLGFLRSIIVQEKIKRIWVNRCEYEQFFEKFITQQIWKNIKSRTLNENSFDLIFNLLSYCLTYTDDSKQAYKMVLAQIR